jgi:hypothetical protein
MPQTQTKTQVHPVLAPRGGLNFSLPADLIGDLEMSDCRNVFMEEGRVKKRFGYGTLGGNLPLPSTIIGMDQFYTFSGNSSLLATTTEGVYYLASEGSSPYWETLMENEVEDDCETTWTDPGANITIADESTIKKVGSKSQKITVETAFTTGLIGYRDQSLGDKSAYGLVEFWIRSDTTLAASVMKIIVSDSAACATEEEALNIPALTADTWKRVILEFSGTAAPTSIDSIGLKVVTDLSTTANVNIYIDDIRFIKPLSTSVEYDSDSQDTLSADYMRQADQTDLWWVMTNGVDVPQKWDGNTATALSALISTPPSGVTTMVAKQLIEFKDHLLLLDVSIDGNRYPQRIYWSDTGTPSDFDSGNASYYDLTGADWIQTAIKFKGDYVVVLKERSIWLGYATGDTSIFQFDQKVTGAGCAAPNTVESLGDEIIFLGWDDVYVFDGIDYISIGEDIRDELFDRMNPAQIPKAFGVVVEEQKEYWLFVASTNSDYCDMAWVFNYNLNKWTKHIVYDTTGAYMSSFGYYEKQATLTIGDLVGTIGQQTWRIGDRTILAAAPTTLFADTNGNIYEYDRTLNNDNGITIDAWFSTKDFNLTQLMQRWRLLRIDAYFTGAGMDLEYSADKGRTWTQITSFARNDNLETPQTAYVKLDLLMVRLRCRNAESGEHFEFSRLNLFWAPAGRKL